MRSFHNQERLIDRRARSQLDKWRNAFANTRRMENSNEVGATSCANARVVALFNGSFVVIVVV